MSLDAGARLGPYEILGQAGAGGMGEVYRARDTRLDRTVAIKVLPANISQDEAARARFEREARSVSRLTHPHICALYDIGHEDGIDFLVMEYLEGETLAARLERDGALATPQLLEVGSQVANALAVAHRQGFVHRDLKPANIMLTKTGAKLLDFGLAKPLEQQDPQAGLTATPTATSPLTAAGQIVGTFQYMAPEQLEGKEADARSDLFALGVVLYEMATGQRPFQGGSQASLVAAIMKEEPRPVSGVRTTSPPALDRVVQRCLAKDPDDRWQSASDLAHELRAIADGRIGSGVSAVTPAPAAKTSKLPWIVAAVAIVAALGTWLISGRAEPAPPREPLELSIPIPPEITLSDDQESLLELSPDGRYLVFAGFAADASSPSLYLRRLDDSTIVKLPDTAGAVNPFFSPDSRWVGFFADGQLKKLQIAGDTAVPICEMGGSPRGASWGADDLIVFPEHFAGGLMQVRGSGGAPAPLAELDADRKERTHRWPQVVPGHDVVLFTVATTDSPEFYDDARIDALRLSTGERKTVFQGASFARYVPTGHLVVGRGGFLFGVPFDIERLEATGTPAPVVEGVMGASTSGVVYASIAQNGLLAYVPGKPVSPRQQLTWFYPDGRDEPVAGTTPGAYRDPAVSPDGKYVAVTVAGDRTADIWVFDLERESRARLTFEGDNVLPVWTPDGKSVLFYSVRDGMGSAYMTAADGSGGERLVLAVEGSSVQPTDVSRDGRLVALSVFGDQKADIYVRSLVDPDAEVVPFLAGPADEQHAHFSPDGRWIAYTSDETGNYQVFVRPYPGPGGRWQISDRAGVGPQWSPDGRRIHYRTNRDWWVVDVEPGDGDGQPFRTGAPRLVRNDLPRAQLQMTYGMSRDGEAVLVPVSDDARGVPAEVRVVVDWLAELARTSS